MTNTPEPSFATVDAAIILKVCDFLDGDGHGLYYPQALVECGVPQPLIDTLYRPHTSGSSHKETIIDSTSGQPVAGVTSVYSLDVYRKIGSDLGLASTSFMGRGSQARDWDRRIRAKLLGQVEP